MTGCKKGMMREGGKGRKERKREVTDEYGKAKEEDKKRGGRGESDDR